MKFKSLLNLAIIILAAQMMFACSSAEYYKFAPQKPEAYNKAKEKATPTAEADAPSLSEIALQAAEEEATKQNAEPALEASVAAPVATPKKAVKPAIAEEKAVTETITEAEAMELAKERIASMTKAEKKELKKELKEALKQDRGGGRTSIVEIILAIILPPLAVFLHDGIGTSFWINIILTLLFFLPGVIHALLVVTDSI